MSVAVRLRDAWARRSPGLLLLLPLEWLYRGAVSMRRHLYDRGLLKCYRAPVPVVVVGNLALGGSGKTPVVMALAQTLNASGVRCGVVSRGYGRRASGVEILSAASTPAECGDEPVMIHRRTGCPTAVAASRPRAVAALLAAHPLDVVLSDDGLQHYALARDLEVIMYDAETGFGSGHCLPVGPLREPLSRLHRADMVLARGGQGPESVLLIPEALVNLATGESRPVSTDGLGPAVHAVAGIANPDGFLADLRTAGFELRARVFPDHHEYRAKDFASLQDLPVIMTEKDAVKCRQLAGPNAWYLKVNAQLPNELLQAVRDTLKSPAPT